MKMGQNYSGEAARKVNLESDLVEEEAETLSRTEWTGIPFLSEHFRN